MLFKRKISICRSRHELLLLQILTSQIDTSWIENYRINIVYGTITIKFYNLHTKQAKSQNCKF